MSRPKILGESAQGFLVPSPIAKEEKLVTFRLVSVVNGQVLPYEAESNKIWMEDCLDELELDDLE